MKPPQPLKSSLKGDIVDTCAAGRDAEVMLAVAGVYERVREKREREISVSEEQNSQISAKCILFGTYSNVYKCVSRKKTLDLAGGPAMLEK